MPIKTFGVGDVLTASDVNTYLMKQTVIVCTSGTRPSSPVTGMTIYETDSDYYWRWNGSAWVINASPRTVLMGSDLALTTTTMVDTALAFGAISGATYMFETNLFHHANTTAGDLDIQFAHSGGTVHWGAYLADIGVTTSLAQAEFRGRPSQTTSPTSTLSTGTAADAIGLFGRTWGTFICTTSGSFRLQAALHSANPTTTLMTGSSITYTRIS